MQARWYSPGTATFRSRDTFAGHLNTPVSLNRHTYAGNNPIRYWDPTGYDYEVACGCYVFYGATDTTKTDVSGGAATGTKRFYDDGSTEFSYVTQTVYDDGNTTINPNERQIVKVSTNEIGEESVSTRFVLSASEESGLVQVEYAAEQRAGTFVSTSNGNYVNVPIADYVAPRAPNIRTNDTPCGGFFDCMFHSGQPDNNRGAIGQMINRGFTQPVQSCNGAKESLIDQGGCGFGLIQIGISLKGLVSGGPAATGVPSVLDDAAFAQRTFSQNFSRGRSFSGLTIDDVAVSLRSGHPESLGVADVPIQIVVRNGNTLILNTRSAEALTRAGIPRSQWAVTNLTGNAAAEARLTGQLTRSGLDSTGILNPTPRGAG
jgi:hypothetical protein